MHSAAIRGERPGTARFSSLRYAGIVLGIAAVYAVTGRLGLLLAQTQENATLIWAPTGIALAALVLLGPRHWPGVLLGAAITNASIGTPAGPLLAITLGNTLEAVVGWALLTRVAKLNTGFARLRDVLAFLVFGVLLSTAVSATIGVGGLYLGGALGAQSFAQVWLIWWLGDAGGAAVVAPLILVGVDGRPSWGTLARKGEAWAALLLLAALMSLAFGGALPEPWEALLLALLAFPVVVWVGLRLGPRGAVVGGFLAGAAAVIGTARGRGPFALAGLGNDLFLLWAYVFALGTITMILAAAIAEAEDAEAARRTSDDERGELALQLQHVQRLESLGLLAGGIAHDFNNLLMAIRSNAELLRRHPEGASERREEMLGSIESASDQAAELCRQLLIYAGQGRPQRSPVDLESILREMAPLLRTSTGSEVALELSPAPVPAILGDRAQLGQVLMNLVLNATQATLGHGNRVSVSLETREVTETELRETFLHSDAPPGRFVVLRVSDDGSGMPPAVRQRIFDPFFTTKPEGRGLGMPSVLGIVRAHDGAIKVRSAPGEGSVFEVLLPVLEGAEVKATEPPAERASEPPAAQRVLLADDNEQVRKVTGMLLERAGFSVVTVADGDDAVARFEAEPEAFDVLLFDVKMPRMSGTEALATIRSRAPGFPAVLMSGYDDGLTRDVVDAAFIAKPFQAHALVDALHEVTRDTSRAHGG